MPPSTNEPPEPEDLRKSRETSEDEDSVGAAETEPVEQGSVASNDPLDATGHDHTQPSKKKKKKKKRFLLAAGNFISQFFLLWVYRLVQLNSNKADVRNVVFVLAPSETAKYAGDRVSQFWEDQKKSGVAKPSIFMALFNAFGYAYFPLALWKLIWAGSTWFGTYYMLLLLIDFQETGKENLTPGYLYATGLFACTFIGSLCFHQLTIQTTRIGIQCRAALMVMIYRKSLMLSYVKGGVGDIVNLISNECNRVAEACVHWHSFWSAVLHCVMLFVVLWIEIGVASLAPMCCIFLFLLPFQYLFARWTSIFSGRVTHLITQRVHLMSEVLTAVLKFNARSSSSNFTLGKTFIALKSTRCEMLKWKVCARRYH